MLWIYIVIAVSIILVFAINLTLKRTEHLSQNTALTKKASFIEPLREPVLKEPITTIEFNRNNIPIDVRNRLSDLLYKKLLLKTGEPVLPIGFEYVKIQKDSDKSLWTVEGFINNGCDQVQHKIVWQFWMLPGETYQLKLIRPFSTRDSNSSLVRLHNNKVITNDNLTNPFINNLQSGLTNSAKTELEMTPIESDLKTDIENRQGRQPWATTYNKWILPKGIHRTDLFATFTPDIINNNLYRTGKYDDLFSRTRHDPGFPHGTATGGV